MGQMDSFIEGLSERAGGVIGFFGKSKIATKHLDALMKWSKGNRVGKRNKFLDFAFGKWRKSNPNRTRRQFNRTMEAIGLNGIIGEMYEEELGKQLRAVVGIQKYKVSDVWELLGQFGGFLLPGGARAVTRRVYERRTDREIEKFKKTLNRNTKAIKVRADEVSAEEGFEQPNDIWLGYEQETPALIYKDREHAIDALGNMDALERIAGVDLKTGRRPKIMPLGDIFILSFPLAKEELRPDVDTGIPERETRPSDMPFGEMGPGQESRHIGTWVMAKIGVGEGQSVWVRTQVLRVTPGLEQQVVEVQDPLDPTKSITLQGRHVKLVSELIEEQVKSGDIPASEVLYPSTVEEQENADKWWGDVLDKKDAAEALAVPERAEVDVPERAEVDVPAAEREAAEREAVEPEAAEREAVEPEAVEREAVEPEAVEEQLPGRRLQVQG
jgi:hypothetical protein